MSKEKTEKVLPRKSLLDLVFSWSISDVLNKDLYKNQVKKIPETFLSTTDYMESFKPALIEETRADLSSNLEMVFQAPTREISSIETTKEFKPPKDLFYKICLKQMKKNVNGIERYEPEVGDLLALTDVTPEGIEDLNRPGINYLLAYVEGSYIDDIKVGNENDKDGDHEIRVLTSKPLLIELEDRQTNEHSNFSGGLRLKNKRDTLFLVYLANMTTGIRIWRSLNSGLEGQKMNIIKSVLQANSNFSQDCTKCSTEVRKSDILSGMRTVISSSNLNDSQEAAVVSCIGLSECQHQNTIKLIWGPPGTGKTKTVSLFLSSLLKMKCRTLACAPTNVAVLGVTSRVLSLVTGLFGNNTYGLGDILLFGNAKRMKISEHDDLQDIFLDHRVKVLSHCLSPLTGWKHGLESMINFLDDPEHQYWQYLSNRIKNKAKTEEQSDGIFETEEKNSPKRKDEGVVDQKLKGKKILENVVLQALKGNRKMEKQKQKASSNGKKVQKWVRKEDTGGKIRKDQDKKHEDILTFEEFVKKMFRNHSEKLEFFFVNLYTHMPTSIISLEVVKQMIRALDLLSSLKPLLSGVKIGIEGLKWVNDIENEGNGVRRLSAFTTKRKDCLHILKSLSQAFEVPKFRGLHTVKMFCLKHASLLFCTASSSAKLDTPGMPPLKLLVIDEAAQLKECESTIPLQLSGLQHAVLIGDERQLPAMVQSKICEEVEFGRSLFERLVKLGHEKHLLNMQYRMHPSISSFPNSEFYDGLIQDAPNVKESTYHKNLLQGKMYGPYSFINIANGLEQFSNGCSKKNIVEVAVVSEILASLFKEFMRTRKRMSVGVISAYKAQVHAIQDKIGTTYSAHNEFCVNVRSVDGFQGGEEDVIIFSTVRCNANGSVGFLSSRQRSNVALTRARYCLWILGNGATLINSDSIWKKLVVDAKKRDCFYNAEDEKCLSVAIMDALVELNQLDALLNVNSILFRNAKWQFRFSDDFRKSIARVKTKTRQEVFSLLRKLSGGWRQPRKERDRIVLRGTSSEMIEHCRVDGQLNLIWTVDIIKEISNYTQCLKVWDILKLSDLQKLAKRLDVVFGNFTVDKMNRCKHKCVEGNLVVPLRWSVDSRRVAKSSYPEEDAVELLSQPLGTLAIRDEPEASAGTKRQHWRIRKYDKSRNAEMEAKVMSEK